MRSTRPARTLLALITVPQGGQVLDSAGLGESGGSVEEVLQGRVPGLQVSRGAEGGYVLRIRGTGSLNASGDPLPVIDGVIVPEFGVSSALGMLRPRDIDRVEILKDAAAVLRRARRQRRARHHHPQRPAVARARSSRPRL